jgi:flagellar biosynthesis protein FliR
MTEAVPQFLLSFFVVFGRLGMALMLLPAFSNSRFPTSIRLLTALAVALALTPYLAKHLTIVTVSIGGGDLMSIMAAELLLGLLIGFWGYCHLHAARFAGTFIANAIGLAGIPGQPIDENEPSSQIGSLLSIATTALIFAGDLHLVTVQALIGSYESFPVGVVLSEAWIVEQTLATLRDTFILATQICSPFIVFAVVANIALGLASRFTPQLSIYFATLGMTTVSGLALLAIAVPQSLSLMIAAYAAWLEGGI